MTRSMAIGAARFLLDGTELSYIYFNCCRVVLVDAPLLLASQLREYWRLGQKAGYEVFIGQPLELDPQVPPCSGPSQPAAAAAAAER